MWSESSAPASLMVMGEYAVVNGMPALVMACDIRIRVRVRYRKDQAIHLFSEKYGRYQTHFEMHEIPHQWRFVLTAILTWKKKLKYGLDVEIDSEISDQEGLGSSAAVSVATNHALMYLCEHIFPKRALLRLVRRQIRKIQGMGSGADAAASIYGGFIYYDPILLHVHAQAFPWPCFRYYLGYKTPTPEVFARVQAQFLNRQDEYQSILLSITECVQLAWQAIANQDIKKLNEQIARHQNLLKALGVCDEWMQLIIELLLKSSNVMSVKISGSGLGDCLIGVGEPTVNPSVISNIIIASEGVRHEKTSHC